MTGPMQRYVRGRDMVAARDEWERKRKLAAGGTSGVAPRATLSARAVTSTHRAVTQTTRAVTQSSSSTQICRIPLN